MQDEQRFAELQEWFRQGVERYQEEDWAGAEERFRRILAEIPDGDRVHYNLGLALYGQERFQEAGQAFLEAARLNPADPDYWFNAGLAMKQAGRFEQALVAYEQARRLNGEDADLLYNIGCCRQAAGDRSGAVEAYRQVLALVPDHQEALGNLAYCTHLLGDLEEAARLFRDLLKLRPDHEAARFILDGLEGRNSDHPPEGYVSQLFDDYSAHFEHDLLVHLQYRVPGLLAGLLAEHFGREERQRLVVDLGCGTGLAGQAIRAWAHPLIGVDLSPGMVARAEEKGCYHHLFVGDVVCFLEEWNREPIELLLAADVLTYLGDLTPLFKAAARRMAPEGLFCFSTEKGDGEDWQLRPTGRYGHSHHYIRSLADETGWRLVSAREEEIRQERGRWVTGMVYLLERHENKSSVM